MESIVSSLRNHAIRLATLCLFLAAALPAFAADAAPAIGAAVFAR